MFYQLIDILGSSVEILNLLAGIVGGIWLLALGQWKLVAIGIFLIFFLHYGIAILLIPRILLTSLGVSLYEKGNSLSGSFFIFLSLLYNNLIFLAICLLTFAWTVGYYNNGHFESMRIGISYIPYLLWAWEISIGPWNFLASKEPDNEFTFIILLSGSIAYLAFLVSTFWGLGIALKVGMVVGFLFLVVVPVGVMGVGEEEGFII